MGTPKMQIASRSKVIGRTPRPETRGAVREKPVGEVFGETIERSEQSPDRPDHRSLAAAAAA
jgi:hypothetical protein